jgi:2-amino-4-hydroxy-6-hydroxymethyldihydropteridine diphosphokinase
VPVSDPDDPNGGGGPAGPADRRKARAGNGRRGATQENRRAFLALGSNLGDRRHHLAAAIARIPEVVAVSPIYETDPVGGPPGQGAYLNCVVELRTTRPPRELLMVAQAAEAAARRVRLERWGPRTLDVDVLLVGDETVDEPDLIVPHPRMWERGFVLVPLGDLAPELVRGRLTPELAAGVRPAGTL